MDNQHRKISGYRELSEDEIAMINKVKELGALNGELLDQLKQLPGVDQRWLAIARTDVQTGFMALVRAVAQPTTFC